MRGILLMLAGLILFATPVMGGSGDGKTFLIHAKTSMSLDDAQICAVPNVAWAAMQDGFKVVILFDASGVTALKKGSFFGGDKTPLDKVARAFADLAGEENIRQQHLAEAVQYRRLDRKVG